MIASIMQQPLRRDTVVLELPENLGSASCQAFEARCHQLEADIHAGAVRNIVIDGRANACLGGTALGLLLGIWRATKRYEGQFALSGLSPLGLEVLGITYLRRLWPSYDSLNEAILAIESQADHGSTARPA